ncbi:MAG: helix-turn-helix domain-containing protein, partial [Myxococcota bacterium]
MSRSYAEYCALAKGLDVLGDRWVLLIARNLLLGPQRYSELRRDLPGIASNMLAQRLEHLQAHDLVEHDGERYALTETGRTLEPVIFAIARWGEAHALGAPKPGDHLRVRYLVT